MTRVHAAMLQRELERMKTKGKEVEKWRQAVKTWRMR